MYFEFYELKSWGKRSANNRRRFNQWLLQGSLCGFAAIRGGKPAPYSPTNGNLLGYRKGQPGRLAFCFMDRWG